MRRDQAQDRYLLQRRTLYPRGVCVTPAGHLEQGETPVEAVIKEVYEETGLTVVGRALLIHNQVLHDDCCRSVNYHL